MKRPRVERSSPAKLYSHECACGCGRKFRGGVSAKLAPACKAARVKKLDDVGGARDRGHRWLSPADRAMLTEAAGPDPAEPRIRDEFGSLVGARSLAVRYRRESDPDLRGRR